MSATSVTSVTRAASVISTGGFVDDEAMARALAEQFQREEDEYAGLVDPWDTTTTMSPCHPMSVPSAHHDDDPSVCQTTHKGKTTAGDGSSWSMPTHRQIPEVEPLSAALRGELPSGDRWERWVSGMTSFPPLLPFERDALVHLHLSRIPMYPPCGYPQTIEDVHFCIAESLVLRLMSGSWSVIKVERVVNPVLYHRYVEFGRSNADTIEEERLMFHGTRNTTIPSILREGFKIGGKEIPMVTGAVHGQGVYLSEDPSFAMRYVRHVDTDSLDDFSESGSKCLLFVRCWITRDTKKVVSSSSRGSSTIQQVVCPRKEQVVPYYLVYIKSTQK